MPGLRRSLAARHVTMISMGGIIGAGLFVGSSAAIAVGRTRHRPQLRHRGCADPARDAHDRRDGHGPADVRSFTDFARAGLGAPAGFVTGWLYWYFWLHRRCRSRRSPAQRCCRLWIALPAWLLRRSCLIAVMTACEPPALDARYGEFEFWFASLKVTAIVGLLLLARVRLCRRGCCARTRRASRTWYATAALRRTGALAVLAGGHHRVLLPDRRGDHGGGRRGGAATAAGALTRMTTSVISRIMSVLSRLDVPDRLSSCLGADRARGFPIHAGAASQWDLPVGQHGR